jgi:hypothetical protein
MRRRAVQELLRNRRKVLLVFDVVSECRECLGGRRSAVAGRTDLEDLPDGGTVRSLNAPRRA